MRQGVIKGIAAVLLSAVAVSANAAVSWSTPNGVTPNYNYSNGQSALGLFGDPLVLASSFVFFPNNFKAVATNGGAQTTSDILSFDIDCLPNQTVTAVNVNEIGDYAILGGGTVQAGGTLDVTNLLTTATTSVSLVSTPGSPISTGTSANGTWTALATATNLPNGWTKFHVSLTNILQASANVGGTATIQKKFESTGLEVSVIVPEPASIGLLMTAGAGLLIRRRR